MTATWTVDSRIEYNFSSISEKFLFFLIFKEKRKKRNAILFETGALNFMAPAVLLRELAQSDALWRLINWRAAVWSARVCRRRLIIARVRGNNDESRGRRTNTAHFISFFCFEQNRNRRRLDRRLVIDYSALMPLDTDAPPSITPKGAATPGDRRPRPSAPTPRQRDAGTSYFIFRNVTIVISIEKKYSFFRFLGSLKLKGKQLNLKELNSWKHCCSKCKF